MTTAVTKESLAARITDLESGARSLKEDYTLAAYKMLLATMEAEPVGYLFHNEYGAVLYSISDDATEGFSLIGSIYSVPQPAPVVPDAYVRDEHGRMMLNGVCEPKIGFGTGWNACRAAMLAAAPREVKGE